MKKKLKKQQQVLQGECLPQLQTVDGNYRLVPVPESDALSGSIIDNVYYCID